MKSTIRDIAKTLGVVFVMCAISELAWVISERNPLIEMNPFIKGYIHIGADHFLTNVAILFLALLSPVNKSYDFKKIYRITLIISLIYFPAELFGFSETALGLSGTCYFLLSRYFFSWKQRSQLGAFIIGILALLELGASINTPSDKTAHFVHVLGIALGYLSIRYSHKKSLEKLGF